MSFPCGYGEVQSGIIHRGLPGGRAEDVHDEVVKLKQQALNLLVGELLGSGAYRRVYALRHAPDLVLKLEYSPDFANVSEWRTWCDLEHSEWAQWLAPCVAIDEFGGALVQKRAPDLTDEQWAQLREHPAFLGDTGRRNWGWYDGRPVMRDYAFNHLVHRGLKNVRMHRWAEKDIASKEAA